MEAQRVRRWIVATIVVVHLPCVALARPATVWILGDSNSGGIYLAYQRLFASKHPEWRVVNHAIPATDTVFGVAHATDLLRRHQPPDVVVVTYGGADILRAMDGAGNARPVQQLANDILGRLLMICAAFIPAGSRCVLGASIGALNRRHPEDVHGPTARDLRELIYLDQVYRELGRSIRGTWRSDVDFRLPHRPDLWSAGPLGYIHASDRGYAVAAKRLERFLKAWWRRRASHRRRGGPE
jgi:lysophospholipase L1-like esterase